MKRSISAKAGSPPRKLARRSSTPPQLPLEAQSPGNIDPEDIAGIDTFRQKCDKYNRLLPFAQNLASPDGRSAAHQRGVAVEKTVVEIKDLMDDVMERMSAKFDQLEDRVSGFRDSIHASHGWYENGDLLSLTLEDLREISKPMESRGADINRFIRYVYRIIPEAVRKPPPGDENHPFYNPRYNQWSLFIQKCFVLIQVVINHGQRRQTFHLLVLLISVLRKANVRVTYWGLESEHSALHNMIRAFLGGKAESRMMLGLTKNSWLHGSQPVRDSGHVEAEDFTCQYTDRPGSQYWDFASAARTLRTAYLDQLCGQAVPPLYYPADYENESRSCFHRDTIDPLNTIQIQAWSEIRASVFLTMGTIFATEITERIFECTLEAEHVPLNPRIFEEFLVDPPRKKVKRLSGRSHLKPRKYRRINSTYICCNTRNRNPDSVFSYDEYNESEGEDADSEADGPIGSEGHAEA